MSVKPCPCCAGISAHEDACPVGWCAKAHVAHLRAARADEDALRARLAAAQVAMAQGANAYRLADELSWAAEAAGFERVSRQAVESFLTKGAR